MLSRLAIAASVPVFLALYFASSYALTRSSSFSSAARTSFIDSLYEANPSLAPAPNASNSRPRLALIKPRPKFIKNSPLASPLRLLIPSRLPSSFFIKPSYGSTIPCFLYMSSLSLSISSISLTFLGIAFSTAISPEGLAIAGRRGPPPTPGVRSLAGALSAAVLACPVVNAAVVSAAGVCVPARRLTLPHPAAS